MTRGAEWWPMDHWSEPHECRIKVDGDSHRRALGSVHRRAHGWVNSGVPRREDPIRRDAGRVLHNCGARNDSCVRSGDLGSCHQRFPRFLIPGTHGLSEVMYDFVSAGNNNGSAFGGMNSSADWFTPTQGPTILISGYLSRVWDTASNRPLELAIVQASDSPGIR